MIPYLFELISIGEKNQLEMCKYINESNCHLYIQFFVHLIIQIDFNLQ